MAHRRPGSRSNRDSHRLGRGGSGGAAPVAVEANAVGVVDAASNRLVSSVAVGTNPNGIASGDGAVWVTNAEDHTVSRLDPASATQRQTIDVGSEPEGLA